MSLEALIRLHKGLARLGPGDEGATLRALARCRPFLPERPAVADLGCGTGASALVLARELEGSLLAVDASGVFLEELRQRAERAGLGHRVRTREADFAELGLEPSSFDLLWSEGAIYLLGFEAGLVAWRPLLRPGGCLVVSEATWLTADPPAEIRERWEQWYPAMGTVDSNGAVARAAGFEVLEAFPLPASAWWAYYDPLWANCLAERAGAPDAGMRDVIAETELELSMFRRFGRTYGYVFYVLRKSEEER